MSLKHNILSNYVSQAYVTLAGIVVLPLYLKYMGADAYGLVGFFAMIQAWFGILDVGLTPTVARETSRFHGGAVTATDYRKLLRALQVLFVTVAIAGAICIISLADLIGNRWINSAKLQPDQVVTAIQLMAVGISMRWMSGFYRAVVSGAERLIWLSGFNVFVATFRFVLIIPILIYVSSSTATFFIYQIIVAAIELAAVAVKAHTLFPLLKNEQRLGWTPHTLFKPVLPVIKFSLSIAFTSTVWIFVTQTDKLILSKILPLSEYGFFTLAVLAASGIMMISGPISSALLPRMTRLQAGGEEHKVIVLYRSATRFVSVITIPCSLVLSFAAEQVMWAWSGDRQLATEAAPVLRLYAIGNGLLTLSAFPFYLQFAKGQIKLHLLGNILFAAFLLPLIVYFSMTRGMLGAGYAWAGCNTLYFLVWVPIVHKKFMPGLHNKWILADIAYPFLLATVPCLVFIGRIPWSDNRLIVLLELLLLGTALLGISSLSIPQVRKFLRYESSNSKNNL
jgi:O-antigen/teichoic acid export membrane protein